MCLAQGTQRSDAGEARTRGPSASSQALYHWLTALPNETCDAYNAKITFIWDNALNYHNQPEKNLYS